MDDESQRLGEAVEDLPQPRANLLALVENIDDFILFSDRSGSPVFYNRRYAEVMRELLGVEMRPGLKPHSLLPEPERALWEACHRRVLGGERFRFDYEHAPPGGPRRTFEVSYNPVYQGDEIVGFSEFTREVTDRRRAETEAAEMRRQVAEARRLESLGLLAGSMAHDFNNLLVPILGNAQLALARMGPSSPARDAVGRVVQAARRAAELTRQILGRAGRGGRAFEVHALGTLVRGVVDLTNTWVPPGVTIGATVSGDVPVRCDETQVRQLLLNLLTNASDAVRAAGGQIDVSVDALDLTEAELAGWPGGSRVGPGRFARLVVADDGPGMDEEVLDRAFEPFFSTKADGRGLGLASVLGVVRTQGGVMRVRSTPGDGARFEVLLPLAEEGDGPRGRTRRRRVRGGDTSALRGCVLVVDDDAPVREVVAELLGELGVEAVCAASGAEALEHAGALDGEVICAVIDLQMPGMSGPETADALGERWPDLPVIFTSGAATPEVVRSSIHADGSYLQKPYSLDELRVALVKAVAGE